MTVKDSDKKNYRDEHLSNCRFLVLHIYSQGRGWDSPNIMEKGRFIWFLKP